MNYQNLLINLFESRRFIAGGTRLSAQIKQRDFELDDKCPNLEKFLEDDPYRKKIEYILSVLKKPRNYSNFCSASCDSYYILEELGLGLYTLDYVVICDFSDTLAEILELVTGEDANELRKMPNYHYISDCILNLSDYNKSNIKFSNILNVEYSHIIEFITQKCKEPYNTDQILSEFIGSILAQLNVIMEYTVKAIQNEATHLDNGLIYRSHSFCKAILTAKLPYERDLILKCNNTTINVPVRTFNRCEYISDFRKIVKYD